MSQRDIHLGYSIRPTLIPLPTIIKEEEDDRICDYELSNPAHPISTDISIRRNSQAVNTEPVNVQEENREQRDSISATLSPVLPRSQRRNFPSFLRSLSWT